jgi:uncharacterized protein YijF (DUF1287 family)
MSLPTFQEKSKISISTPRLPVLFHAHANDIVTWQKYYSARESYGPLVQLASTQPLTPAVMHNITTAFENNDAAFAQYNERFERAFNVTECEGDCKQRGICAMRAMRSENNCVRPRAPIFLGV